MDSINPNLIYAAIAVLVVIALSIPVWKRRKTLKSYEEKMAASKGGSSKATAKSRLK